jgi:hypothetical protein
MSALGLGCVKTPCLSKDISAPAFGQVLKRNHFGDDYALIAVMSGLVPMMFMTRVRL